MKKLLNTLYVTKQGTYLHQEGETIVAELEKKIILRLPAHTLSGLVCFGNVLCSPALLALCSKYGIHVSFLTEYGKFLARVEGPVSGNVLLRIQQMKTAMDSVKSAEIAKSFLYGKILNSRSIIQRRLRDHGENPQCHRAVDLLANSVRLLKKADNLESIRGLEGDAAAVYFESFNELILTSQDNFYIRNRNRRPPLDPMNALLSFIYTILAHDCEAALETVGLDPQIGFLHALRSGRPSLALDLMEEFRAPLADRLALSLVNLKQIQPEDFTKTETGTVNMHEKARKTLLTVWQNKKQETIQHPFLNEKVKIGLLPHIQASLLARFIRGDIDIYPPFIVK